jgi:hypothetical protein
MAVAARQAKSQILAASSTGDGPEKARLPEKCKSMCDRCKRFDLKNAQNPIKQSSTHAKPPNLVFVGAPAKISAKQANASAGKGRRVNAYCFFG